MHSPEQVVEFLKQQKLILTTAESCTAGLMASLLADVPGCGSVLESGYVVYAPQAKQRCLGVRPETIERFGLTSEEVAREMALGALRVSGGTIAIANNGVADDDTEEAAGVQCFAWALSLGDRQVVISETARFDGDRSGIRIAAARYGLGRLPHCHRQLLDQADAAVDTA